MYSKSDKTSSPAQFTFDLNDNQLFERNSQNYINELSIDQLNTLKNTSILDIHLSNGYIVEPHYHQDSTELIYCIRGGVTVSMIDPSTKQLHSYPITANQVVNIPQGWWHYIVSDADHTQILGIFNAPKPKVILASDILNGTPADIIADTYCVNKAEWKKAIAPIPSSVFIGPLKNCKHEKNQGQDTKPVYPKRRKEQWNPYSYNRR